MTTPTLTQATPTTIPDVGEKPTLFQQIVLAVFVGTPLLAIAAAIPVAWGWGVGPVELAVAAFFYVFTSLGITIGFHRLFTHKSFKANRVLKFVLAAAGSMAIEGDLIQWVADHRKHHKFSDADGDPHSPWRYGTSPKAVAKGLWFSHTGWFFTVPPSERRRYAPDLCNDPMIARIAATFPAWIITSLVVPPLLVAGLTQSWTGLITGFFWASLVRIGLVHHVTWSVNSICHVYGNRPFRSKDQASNVWWLAPFSHGESWHNFHHAEPNSARHGVLPRQVDTSAALIRLFEKAGWATQVRWPSEEKIKARLLTAEEIADKRWAPNPDGYAPSGDETR